MFNKELVEQTKSHLETIAQEIEKTIREELKLSKIGKIEEINIVIGRIRNGLVESTCSIRVNSKQAVKLNKILLDYFKDDKTKFQISKHFEVCYHTEDYVYYKLFHYLNYN